MESRAEIATTHTRTHSTRAESPGSVRCLCVRCTWAQYTCLLLIWGCVCVSVSSFVIIMRHIYAPVPELSLWYTHMYLRRLLWLSCMHIHTQSHTPKTPLTHSLAGDLTQCSHTLPHAKDLNEPHFVSLSPRVKTNHGYVGAKEKTRVVSLLLR